MNDLLTAKEVQEILRVHRTTLYRMLKNGWLTGIKVGEQWRFSRREVEALLSNTPAESVEKSPSPCSPDDTLPLHCVQRIQAVFAEVAGVGAVTTGPDGEPFTQISNSCKFCQLIQASESGRLACVDSWRKLAEQPEHQFEFTTCHAGLQYAHSRIEVDGKLAAVLIAGQFYAQSPSPEEEQTRLHRLAERHRLDGETLRQAAQELLVLDEHKQARIGAWLQSVAHTFADIGLERAELMDRLRSIAKMSTFPGGDVLAAGLPG